MNEKIMIECKKGFELYWNRKYGHVYATDCDEDREDCPQCNENQEWRGCPYLVIKNV